MEELSMVPASCHVDLPQLKPAVSAPNISDEDDIASLLDIANHA